MRRHFTAVVALAILIWPALAPAADETRLLSQRAPALAESCAACHGPDGRAEAGIPPLAGNPEAVMRAQLLAFRNDEIPGATVMPRLARGFSEEELKALAAWFAGLDPEEESGPDSNGEQP
jgi:cytochrome subunit of sulfide dehydrogenase